MKASIPNSRTDTEHPRWPVFMRRKVASEYLLEVHAISALPSTLASYASLGIGPAYELRGKFPVYKAAWLDEWAHARYGLPQRDALEEAPCHDCDAVRAEHAVKDSAGKYVAGKCARHAAVITRAAEIKAKEAACKPRNALPLRAMMAHAERMRE